jgi:hypothetical protein
MKYSEEYKKKRRAAQRAWYYANPEKVKAQRERYKKVKQLVDVKFERVKKQKEQKVKQQIEAKTIAETKTTNNKKSYLTNSELLEELRICKKKGVLTDKMAGMFVLLVKRYATKGNWVGYSYNEDMQGVALVDLCRQWNKFDETKSNNPFAFFTQCVKNTFIQFLNKEKKQRDIKNALIVEAGASPSDSYAEEMKVALHRELEKVAHEPEIPNELSL